MIIAECAGHALKGSTIRDNRFIKYRQRKSKTCPNYLPLL
jgi:hypothetical protein